MTEMVRVRVSWTETHSVFGVVEVHEGLEENRAAVLEAIDAADRRGVEWDTDPVVQRSHRGRRELEWWPTDTEPTK